MHETRTERRAKLGYTIAQFAGYWKRKPSTRAHSSAVFGTQYINLGFESNTKYHKLLFVADVSVTLPVYHARHLAGEG